MNLTKVISKDPTRQAMQLAILHKGYFVATDSHTMVVIKANTVPHFGMETDGRVFDKEALAVISKAKKVIFEEGDTFEADGVHYPYTGDIADDFTISMDESRSKTKADGQRYPDYLAVIPEEGTFELSEMRFNADILGDLQKAFAGKVKGVKLKYSSHQENRAYRVTPIGDGEDFAKIIQYGIIMPFKA